MIIFINYISRSGSTYLCRLLDEYAEIGVGIEAGFPGFTKYLISPEFNPIKDDKYLKQYLDLLFEDIRFKQWSIDRNQLIKNIKNYGFPIRFNNILNSILELYFKDHDYSIFVHKAGYYINCFDDVTRLFPESKSIYVIRDPRAIYNSMKSAKDLYSERSMDGNILNFIALYKREIKLVGQLHGNSNFHSLKYEDLIQNPDNSLDRILDFVGLINRDKKESSDYSQQIPDNQKQLHENVKSGPILKNIDKWHSGLSKTEICLIQSVLSEELDKLGYEQEELRLKWSEMIKVRMLLLKYRIQNIKNMIWEKLNLALTK